MSDSTAKNDDDVIAIAIHSPSSSENDSITVTSNGGGGVRSNTYKLYPDHDHQLRIRAHLDFDSELEEPSPIVLSPTPFIGSNGISDNWVISHGSKDEDDDNTASAVTPQINSVSVEESANNGNNSIVLNKSLPIKLRSVEKKIFRDLEEFVTSNPFEGIEVEIRVAGGWVRDRLIGRPTKDLDVAVSGVTGVQFATMLLSWLEKTGKKGAGRLAVIQANPDQSKHLETAKVDIHGLEVDFVNLRSEAYADSRIPDIKIGSPEEDAFRRDFCCNALFYNVLTERIEDFTGYGLMDLEYGILRTPLRPKGTFLDDPLRVLRCVRFATRYRYQITKEVMDEMTSPVVHQALRTKVSRERFGIELSGTFCDGCHISALTLLKRTGLGAVVFGLDDESMEISTRILQRLQMALGSSPGILDRFYNCIPERLTSNKREKREQNLDICKGPVTPSSFYRLLKLSGIDRTDFFHIVAITILSIGQLWNKLGDNKVVSDFLTDMVVKKLKWNKKICNKVITCLKGISNLDAYLTMIQEEEVESNINEQDNQNRGGFHLTILDSNPNWIPMGLKEVIPEMNENAKKNILKFIIRDAGDLWCICLLLCLCMRAERGKETCYGSWKLYNKVIEDDTGTKIEEQLYRFRGATPVSEPISFEELNRVMEAVGHLNLTSGLNQVLNGVELKEVIGFGHPVLRYLGDVSILWATVSGENEVSKNDFKEFIKERVMPILSNRR